MDDRDIEKLLRRYAPAEPPPQLRARILRAARPARVWPWAMAASLLLVATIALRMLTAHVAGDVAIEPGPDVSSLAAADLTEMLGGDDIARRYAEAAVARTTQRVSRSPDAATPEIDEEGLR